MSGDLGWSRPFIRRELVDIRVSEHGALDNLKMGASA